MQTKTYNKYVFSTKDSIRYRFPTHTNELVMDRSEAENSEAFLVVLQPGEAPPLHIHHDTEQVFYVLKGAGELLIGPDGAQRYPVAPGDLARIPPSTHHRILCQSGEPLVYLSVDCFVSGRPQNEPTWDSHVRAICAQNGWDFDKVRASK